MEEIKNYFEEIWEFVYDNEEKWDLFTHCVDDDFPECKDINMEDAPFAMVWKFVEWCELNKKIVELFSK